MTEDVPRYLVFGTMAQFSPLADVARAISMSREFWQGRIYVEMTGDSYRWSPAHPGGAYPLLRVTASILGVPHTSVLLNFMTVDGCAVGRSDERPPETYAFIENLSDDEQGIADRIREALEDIR